MTCNRPPAVQTLRELPFLASYTAAAPSLLMQLAFIFWFCQFQVATSMSAFPALGKYANVS
jgi:hypothetical protein